MNTNLYLVVQIASQMFTHPSILTENRGCLNMIPVRQIDIGYQSYLICIQGMENDNITHSNFLKAIKH